MKSTLAIFHHLFETLPPLFLKETRIKMEQALWTLENDATANIAQIETAMIKFGYEVWPWNRAYREYFDSVEEELGEHFLFPKLSPLLKLRYLDYKHYGGTLQELHTGRPADFFSPSDRAELCATLVENKRALRQYTDHLVLGADREKYLAKVEEYATILNDVERILNDLRELARREEDHPNLADEIRERVKAFEYGLCLLGPELDFEAVCQSMSHFEGRKRDLNRLKGIHLPVEIDLYNV